MNIILHYITKTFTDAPKGDNLMSTLSVSEFKKLIRELIIKAKIFHQKILTSITWIFLSSGNYSVYRRYISKNLI